MNRKAIFFIFLSMLAVSNLGAILRSEDPIRDTQTDGITYKQKVEEEKDGKKGPASYSVKYNPKDTFFVEQPFSKDKEPTEGLKGQEAAATLPDWWEEQPVQKASPSEEQTTVPPDEGGSPAAESSGQGAQEPASGESAVSNEEWW